MQRRDFIAALLAAAAVGRAHAQQTGKVYRIAVVSLAISVADMRGTAANPAVARLYGALFGELRRLGYVEGQNLVVERYSGEGRAVHNPELASEVARSNPEVIIAFSNNLVLDFKAATTTVPIVGSFAQPVESGIVSNLARPEGNITGVSVDVGSEQWSKRYQLLKETAPQTSRVGLLASRALREQFDAVTRKEFSVAGFSLVGPPLDAPFNEAEYRRVFAALAQEGADGLVVDDEGMNFRSARLIVELAERGRLPAIYISRDFVGSGGLMSYGSDWTEIFRHIGDSVDKILRGSRPSEIPIFQPTKFELVINLKTAKALGLTIPPSHLAVADEVIE